MNNLFLILKFWKCDVMAYKYIAKHADLIVDSYWHLQQGGRLLNKLNDHTQCFEHIKGKFSGRIIFARNIINIIMEQLKNLKLIIILHKLKLW